MFAAHEQPTRADKRPVPRRSSTQPRRECSHEVDVSDTQRRVLSRHKHISPRVQLTCQSVRTSKHSPGNPFSCTLGILPTHNPPSQPTPVVNATLSSLLHPWLKTLFARAYALSHAPLKSGTWPPKPGASDTGGGFAGSTGGNSGTPTGEEGIGKGVKGTGVMGTVIGPAGKGD